MISLSIGKTALSLATLAKWTARMQWQHLVGVTIIVATLGSATAYGATRTEIGYGSTVAERYCAQCHQTGPHKPVPSPMANRLTGIPVMPPSFMALANDRRKTPAYLRAFLKLPHFPMPDQSIASGDIPYLIEYIMSLRGAGSPRR